MALTVNPIRVVIADDHHLFRLGLKRALEYEHSNEIVVVDEAKNGEELVQTVARHAPDIAITDIQMPVMNGIEASRQIKQKYPATQVIAFSMFGDTKSIMQMLQSGASGYVVKTSDKDEMVEAIKTVGAGQRYYCSSISDKMYGIQLSSNQQNRRNRKPEFGAQEIKIMQLICRQMCTKEIATSMKLAVRTIENHRYHIQEKIGARNMVGIALYAVINEMVQYSDLL